jgi:ribonucleoside-diphosphate reductase alpha chain
VKVTNVISRKSRKKCELHELYGKQFSIFYTYYEHKAQRGEIKLFKKISAVALWRKMLTMLFETGHPWLTFKDPCNIRSPQQHSGVVHSSNLCTEITLNTSNEEIAVCNLGSINLVAHVTERGLDTEKLQETVSTAMRMLDNVIDINYYSVPQARKSNLRHRPVGLGVMGFQDALYILRLPYASEAALEFADGSMEAVSYYAIQASTDLAEERGRYSTFQDSLWSRGILPIDSLELLKQERGGYLEINRAQTLDWERLRQRVRAVGMRNSNCMAIAPTATISNICGVAQSIEPTYQNLYVKSNLSGEFTVVNPYLVHDLRALGLWDEGMVNDLKYFDGSVQLIERVPNSIKELYATAFEIDPSWLVKAAARRQKWIDQGQSLNLYMREPSGKKLDALYKLAWLSGLKTTYYLRSQAATHVEKSTMQRAETALETLEIMPPACLIDNPECEACQ